MTNWSPKQDEALKAVDHWFKHESKKKQVFRLFGTAGTGKSTLAKHFAKNIDGTVLFAAYTGKAAHVMAQKGCDGATTIHQLIYQPKMASKAKLRAMEYDLDRLKAQPEPDLELIAQVEIELQKERESTSRMSFALNRDSDLRFAKLLIVDEVSMVNQSLAEDILSFGVPVLVLGDPEQLPPIFGEGYFTEAKPDVMLTEIHRQALDNPIIMLSKIVREGGRLNLGNYGDSKVINSQLSGEEILQHDIILTGLRKTKLACDNKARQLLGRSSYLPMRGDSLMCVKNNHSMGILNGQIYFTMADAVNLGGGVVSLHVQNVDNEDEIILSASEKLFTGQKLDRWDHEEDIQEFEYAYAITVHKSQGSQWDRVLLFDQKDRFPMWTERDRRRWLYTGITRAAESVTIMRL